MTDKEAADIFEHRFSDFTWRVIGFNQFAFQGKEALPVVFIERISGYNNFWKIVFHTENRSWGMSDSSDQLKDAMAHVPYYLPRFYGD